MSDTYRLNKYGNDGKLKDAIKCDDRIKGIDNLRGMITLIELALMDETPDEAEIQTLRDKALEILKGI